MTRAIQTYVTRAFGVFFALVGLLCAITFAGAPHSNCAYAQDALEDGNYRLSSLSCDTGMINFDTNDIPGYISVRDGQVYLVATCYNPNKYDAMWKGKRTEAPSDPSSAEGLIPGNFIVMDSEYESSGAYKTNSYTDAEGVTYKALQFVIPLTDEELSAKQIDITVRRAPWSPSNPGQWMGSGNHYLSLGEVVGAYEPAESGQPEETPFDKAKRLIALLPTDPDAITDADEPAIVAAAAAYDALPAAQQKELDETYLGKEQTYGRWLEAAQWGLLAQRPIDSSISLLDGDYSACVSSESSMGKSTSQRARSWEVVKLIVSNGKATAIVRCNSTSAFVNMRVGGVDYKADVIDEVPEFTVPILVNDTTYFTIDANSIADSIAYKMDVTLPLEVATASEVVSAATKAANALAEDWAAYEAASISSISTAAHALSQAAAKEGVTTVELNVAATALDNAVAGAVKKPVADSAGTGNDLIAAGATTTTKSSSKKGSSSASSATSTTRTPATGTSQSQTVPTVSSGTASTGYAGNNTASSSNKKDSSNASASKDKVDDDDVAASASAETVDAIAQAGNSASPQAEAALSAREVSVAGESNQSPIGPIVAGGAVVALLLGGAVVRTFLFVRAKDVA